MSNLLKPISDQVIFITGATSGIGLATVKKATEKGACVFMVDKNEDELQKIQDEMHFKGFHTAYGVADVAEFAQLRLTADSCLKTFGRVDTWINNAGTSIYTKVSDTSEDARRLFDTIFWGVVNGCKIAVDLIGEHEGVIINVESSLPEAALPIQGLHSASKYAVKGHTLALRRELQTDNRPISVSLIMSGTYTEHAPEAVAEAILECAVKPVREREVGASSYIFPVVNRLFSKFRETKSNYPGHVMKQSVFNRIASHRSLIKSGLVAGGATFLLLKRLHIV